MPEEKDELRTLLLELTPEQMQQYYDFGAKCRKALDDARIFYVKSLIEGKTFRDTDVYITIGQ